jgi:Ser/Thr protein kinase RdoA (MazF antagonist)
VDLSQAISELFDGASVERLHGGRQSQVVQVTDRVGRRVVVKAVDAALVDPGEFEARLDVVTTLADLDPRVCRPVPIGGARRVHLDDGSGASFLVVAYEFAPGRPPEVGDPVDAEHMGVVLAELHDAMRRLAAAPLPAVAGLRSAGSAVPGMSGRQLLHGDFNAGNVCLAGPAAKVFDFDDCGYGPVEFDVANALYMVLFDASIAVTPELYRVFRGSFLDGYRRVAPVADAVLDALIDRRVAALRGWLDDVSTAPIGIRTSSAAWRSTLRTFVDTYRP